MNLFYSRLMAVLPKNWCPDRVDGSPGDLSKDPTEFLLIVGIAALMGILYGVFVQPLWSEAVEFGQVWGGTVRYEGNNRWYFTVIASPSLQITIPALLLLTGLKPWVVCLIVTACFCATAFAAVAASSYVLSRHWGFSICMTLAMVSYVFTNNHGYEVSYPVTHFQFGQTGMYFTLLALAFAACELPIVAGILGGLLAGVHAVWWVAFILGAFPVIILFQTRATLKRFVGMFFIFLMVSFLLQGFGEWAMPPKLNQAPALSPSKSIKSSSKGNTHDKISMKSEGAQVHTGTSNTDQNSPPGNTKQKQRTTFQGHNILFADSPSPLKRAVYFFLTEVLFFFLLIAFFSAIGRPFQGQSGEFFGAYNLSLMIAIPMGSAIFFKLIEELDPGFQWLALLDERLPNLALRAIIPRWLNLSILLIPITALSCLVILGRDKRSWLATLGIVGFFFGILFKGNWFLVPVIPKNWIYFGQFPILVIFAALIALKFSKKQAENVGLGQSLVIGGAIVFFFIFEVTTLFGQAFVNQRFLGSDGADALVEIASRENGTLIIAPEVIGKRGFNPQLRSGRPILVPDRYEVDDPETKKTIHIFDFTDPTLSFAQFYANVKPCFENRSPREWAIIRKEIRATGLITPDTWKLKIPCAISAGGFSYFPIPEGATP